MTISWSSMPWKSWSKRPALKSWQETPWGWSKTNLKRSHTCGALGWTLAHGRKNGYQKLDVGALTTPKRRKVWNCTWPKSRKSIKSLHQIGLPTGSCRPRNQEAHFFLKISLWQALTIRSVVIEAHFLTSFSLLSLPSYHGITTMSAVWAEHHQFWKCTVSMLVKCSRNALWGWRQGKWNFTSCCATVWR